MDETTIDFAPSLTPNEVATLQKWQAEDGTPSVTEEVVEPALPAAQGHEFNIGDIRGDGQPYTQEDQEADGAIRGWMTEAGLPKGVGDFLVGEVRTLLPQLASMTDAQRGIFQASERSKLEQVWKGDFHKNLKATRAFVRQIEASRPGLVHQLEQSGLGDSSSLILQLHHASQTRRK